jgi:outer membrane protein OmpA-like peptidoglycan-associated protein
MRKSLYLFAFFLTVLIFKGIYSNAQEYMPFTQSNYSGVSALGLQPASIADSRYKFDMVLFGMDFQMSNNYLAIQRKSMFKYIDKMGTYDFWSGQLEDDRTYVYKHDNGKDKTGLIGLGLYLPSFMVNIDDYSAFAFSATTRVVANFDNISQEFATFLASEFQYDDIIGKQVTNKNISINSQVWTEFGLTYARVIPLNSEVHFMKGGLTLKYLQGIASGYASSPEFRFGLENGEIDSPDMLSIYNSKINYGLSGNFDEAGQHPFDFVSDPGFGMNIGFVYEYRPNINSHKYDMDGKKGMLRPDQDKYLLKIGVALVDIGSIKYTKKYDSQDFTANVINWNLKPIEINSPEDLNDTLKNRFNFKENVIETYKMGLPTALSLQFDYNAAKNFYINFSPYITLRNSKSLNTNTHYYSTFSLTPRYDFKWFGAALPIQIDQFARLRTGLALRLGPVWIGSSTGITNVLSSKSYSTDVYVMLKVPVFRNIAKDRDRDAVSDKLDQCPDLPGVWETMGCPDTDGDGITDANDACPKEAGLKELNGCPDLDGDGIADKDDRCPDLKGTAAHDGCPDTDGDGVIDPEDNCPDVAGVAALNGCPDRDGDGITDAEDNCPDTPGKAEFGGCPFADYDKDGVPDDEDLCPATPGPKSSHGCPDTDGDGVSDDQDLCPKTPGTKENNGCPEIKKEEKEIIAKAFSDLEFETGKDVIKAVSYPSLNELATLLKAKPEWKVKLSGHTDNTGSAALNMELSRKRATAVKDYLVGQGVDADKIITEWFGPDRPIADNKTAAGRQKNRRVEMKIVFE